jgi:hypothetical protein
MKMNPNQLYTIAPVKATEPITIKPEFIRLPKPGARCPYTGLSRGKMNQLVLPCRENGYKPPVRSVSIRQRGQKFAVRLVFFDSLIEYLKSCETDWTKEKQDQIGIDD